MSALRVQTPPCEEILAGLDRFMDREMDLADQQNFREHLDGCPHCAAELHQRQSDIRRLRQALRAQMPPPELRARVNLAIQAAGNQPRSWFSLHFAFAGLACGLAVALSLGAAYQLGHLRFTAEAQDSYIAQISTRVSSLMSVGLGDHVHCTVFRKLPKNTPPVHQLAETLPASYRGLAQLVAAQAPPDARMVQAHQCRYRGRQFIHLALNQNGKLISLVITRKQAGESLDVDSAMRLEHASVQRFQIDAFETREYVAYLVSDLDPASNQRLMARVAPGVRNFLNGLS